MLNPDGHSLCDSYQLLRRKEDFGFEFLDLILNCSKRFQFKVSPRILIQVYFHLIILFAMLISFQKVFFNPWVLHKSYEF